MSNRDQVRKILYPDSQPNVVVSKDLVVPGGVKVVAPLRTSLEVMELLMLSNALDHMDVEKVELAIPYLMGARSDRVMNPGEACGIEVVAELINSMQFKRVQLYDVHSDVATALIKHSHNNDNEELVKIYDEDNPVLIVPDAGAVKKVAKYLDWNLRINDVVYCTKVRDMATGRITLQVLKPELCLNRNCVIIDDLCDGGATFNEIARQIGGKSLVKSFTLIVTHGIFSKGFADLEKNFTRIICSDSYSYTYNSNIVTTVTCKI